MPRSRSRLDDVPEERRHQGQPIARADAARATSPGRAGAAASELASRLGDRGIPIGQRQLLATQFGQVANDAVLQRAVAERQAEAAEDREEEEESLLTAAQALRLD